MTQEDFRRMALAYPGVEEEPRADTTVFRIGRRFLASITPERPRWAVVQLTLADQIASSVEPELFVPLPNSRLPWGPKGRTQINLAACGEHTVRSALDAAWRLVAPRRLVKAHGRS